MITVYNKDKVFLVETGKNWVQSWYTYAYGN